MIQIICTLNEFFFSIMCDKAKITNFILVFGGATARGLKNFSLLHLNNLVFTGCR